MTTVAPVRREIRVDAAPDTAFALFTVHIGAWSPLQVEVLPWYVQLAG